MQLKNLSDEVALLLPDDLLWTDEHAWTPAVASTSYLITGALLIQFRFPTAHPFGGQLAAIEGLRLGMDALALAMDADLVRVP